MNGTFVQRDFSGGMNLLDNDTDIAPNEYRVGNNLRNRYGVLSSVKKAVKDVKLPAGLVQEVITLGNYVIAFVAGVMYYRNRIDTNWIVVSSFGNMSITAPRYWTVAVPVNTTLYGRVSVTTNATGKIDSVTSAASATLGDIPGLLVQDNLSQPVFIYLTDDGPVARTTRTYQQWSQPVYSEPLSVDNREYVPIGNSMTYGDGVLYITAPDFTQIFRSVSGRPLDFMVNVDMTGAKGGDATTTSIGVGVSGISSIKMMGDNTLLVCAGNNNYSMIKNLSLNATTVFGEYLYIRSFLFEATCLSDRAAIVSMGDAKFVDYGGVRTAVGIDKLGNEGRNDIYSSKINGLFRGIRQSVVAAVVFDNYEIYSVNTIYGYRVLVYDNILSCWTSIDNQVEGKAIKQFAKIELDTLHLYAITDTNEFYELYIGEVEKKTVLTRSMIAAEMNKDTNDEAHQICRAEIRPIEVGFVADGQAKAPIVGEIVVVSDNISSKPLTFNATGKQLYNAVLNSIGNIRGWKIALQISDTSDTDITQIHMIGELNFGVNPLVSQK